MMKKSGGSVLKYSSYCLNHYNALLNLNVIGVYNKCIRFVRDYYRFTECVETLFFLLFTTK